MSVTQAPSWPFVEAEIDRIITDSAEEPFDADIVANAREFVRFAREHCSVPEVGRGYLPTVRFSWSMPSLEIEVFADRFEIYRFHDRRTDITEVRHAPGNPLPSELTSDLPKRNAD